MHNQVNVKVLFATASTCGGGAERMLFNIIRSLDSNHTKHLFVTSNDEVPEVYKDDVETIYARKKHAIQSFPLLLKKLRSFKPHYVFTTSSNVGYMLVLAKKILGAKFSVFIRCAVPPSEIYSSGFKSKILRKVIRMTYNSADMIISQSEKMRADLIDSYSLRPAKVKTIRNIIDKGFIKEQAQKNVASEISPDNYNIVAAGALYSVKGFDILIDAIAPLLKDSNKHLYILGEERYEKGYREFLQNKIDRLGVTPNIHLLGHKTNPYPYLAMADLFVMSSRKEGYPNVVLESLALGAPVVATNVVDFSGVIIDGLNGFTVQKESVEELRSGIEKAFHTEFNLTKHSIDNFDYNTLFI